MRIRGSKKDQVVRIIMGTCMMKMMKMNLAEIRAWQIWSGIHSPRYYQSLRFCEICPSTAKAGVR
jgi:hypothetical protein